MFATSSRYSTAWAGVPASSSAVSATRARTSPRRVFVMMPPICFAILRSRSAATLNVHLRTPRAAASLGPRLARNLAQYLVADCRVTTRAPTGECRGAARSEPHSREDKPDDQDDCRREVGGRGSGADQAEHSRLGGWVQAGVRPARRGDAP